MHLKPLLFVLCICAGVGISSAVTCDSLYPNILAVNSSASVQIKLRGSGLSACNTVQAEGQFHLALTGSDTERYFTMTPASSRTYTVQLQCSDGNGGNTALLCQPTIFISDLSSVVSFKLSANMPTDSAALAALEDKTKQSLVNALSLSSVQQIVQFKTTAGSIVHTFQMLQANTKSPTISQLEASFSTAASNGQLQRGLADSGVAGTVQEVSVAGSVTPVTTPGPGASPGSTPGVVNTSPASYITYSVALLGLAAAATAMMV
mmetsp:Transcript_13565/g.31248  ORF Transcript_13565/g.31248 Transcript_13565/m.31248 type:complete len:263 (-) Transcript_13565:52-840(-)|eukprot:CAMPEP_0114557782 /NCGR_PEP_ID=MMETSP0114-20121206/10018_1 /TAXON_ID=31324 /ORGANISM="Goniomonas sp, Strain m" /LENGTH=262 /DNA_ID=CAMNT_0001743101 /DNA_START=21 /DNA_END=809 /DNA_ORIENTATION=+